MTIVIHFHQSEYRQFKAYFTKQMMVHLQSESPKPVRYNCFSELMPGALLSRCVYLRYRLGEVMGIAFFHSTPIAVYHNKRVNRQSVFQELDDLDDRKP